MRISFSINIPWIIKSTRLVFLIGKRVYKFPLNKRGYLQSKNESMIWNKYKETNLRVPLVWERYGIVCQERAVPIEEFSITHLLRVKSTIPELNKNHSMRDIETMRNWGIYKDEVVLVDYGLSEEDAHLYNWDDE